MSSLLIVLANEDARLSFVRIEPVFVSEVLNLILPIDVNILLNEVLKCLLPLIDGLLNLFLSLKWSKPALFGLWLVSNATHTLLSFLLQLDDRAVGLFSISNHDDVTVKRSGLHIQGLLDTVGDQLLLEFAAECLVNSHLIDLVLDLIHRVREALIVLREAASNVVDIFMKSVARALDSLTDLLFLLADLLEAAEEAFLVAL